ncbi:MAG: Polysaccharide transporter, family, partial [Friedmanniella sp.]|nr:Polysaccharide transporter, family [Friedmanniella sp.]
ALVLMMCVLSVGLSRWRPGRPRRRTSIRRFLRVGSHVFGTQVIGYATNNADNVALGAVWGAGPLGIYSRAYQLLMTPINQINDPITRVVLPVLSRVHEDRPTYQRYVEKAQLVGSYVLAPTFSVAAGLSTALVALLFGPAWSAVGPVFVVLAIGGVFRGVGLVTYWIFLSSDHSAAQLRMYLVARPVMIAVILLGLPWGPVGVAAGHTVAFALYWVVSLRRASRLAGLDAGRLFGQTVRALALVSLPCGGLALLGGRLVDGPLLEVGLGVGLAAAYAGLLVMLSPRERGQLRELRQLLGRGRAPASDAPVA